MSDTHTNPAARCPACLKTLDAAYNPWRNLAPSPGDISICAYCTTLLAFSDDLTLRALPLPVYAALPSMVRRQLDMIRAVAAARIRREADEQGEAQ